MRSRTRSPRILSWRIASPQRFLLPVPLLEKGNKDSGNKNGTKATVSVGKVGLNCFLYTVLFLAGGFQIMQH